MKLRVAIILALAILTGLTAGAVYSRKPGAEPVTTTDVVTRGAIINNVSASGTLQAVTTVQVGTQVSGTVQSLTADFNSIVKKGQVLARLEPSLFQSAVEQARANLLRAESDEERLRVGLSNAEVQLERSKQLSARQLIPATDLDAAAVNRDSLQAQVKSAAAAVTQARAALGQAEV
ncbi:MAG TPA: biotin/lipoyl-binding protein, partial [Vicinamibacterales bacterium]